MAAVSTIVAGAALAVAAGSAYSQAQAAKESASERKKAGRVTQAENAASSAENRRQQIREERVRRATILQSSENTGVTASSGQLGAMSALGAQVGNNISNINRQESSANTITNLNQSAANADYRGSQAAQIGSFAGTVFGTAASYRLSSTGGTTPATTGKTNPTVFD